MRGRIVIEFEAPETVAPRWLVRRMAITWGQNLVDLIGGRAAARITWFDEPGNPLMGEQVSNDS